jgi:hypothetical protein
MKAALTLVLVAERAIGALYPAIVLPFFIAEVLLEQAKCLL